MKLSQLSLLAVALLVISCTEIRYVQSDSGARWQDSGAPVPDSTPRVDSVPAVDVAPLRDLAARSDGGAADLAQPVDAAPCAGDPTTCCPKSKLICQGHPDRGIVCRCSNTRNYVIDRVTLPTSSGQAKSVGADLDNDGTIDNAFGQLLAALASAAPSFDAQQPLDYALSRGSAPNILRVTASNYDFTNAPVATLSWAVAKPRACCSSTDATTCIAQARVRCFDGNALFVAPSALAWVALPASISASQLGARRTNGLRLTLAFFSGVTAEVTLNNATVRGVIGAGGIVSGVISGTISKQQISGTLLPGLAASLNQLLTDPAVAQSTKDQIATLFDTDKDGTISLAEVAQNALVKALFVGDVDADGDGTKEMSVGVGFTAVPAIIP